MADRPTKPTIPTAPDRTEPGTFSARADAFVAFMAAAMFTYLEGAMTFTDQRASDASAAAIAGDINSLDLSTFADKAIGVNSAGNAVVGITIQQIVAATQAIAEAGTDNVNYMTALRTKQAIDEFASGGRWAHIITKTASNSASLTFSGNDFDSATYTDYAFVLRNILPATDTQRLQIASSDDDGTTFATITRQGTSILRTAGWVGIKNGAVDADNIGNGTDESGVSGSIIMHNFHQDLGVLSAHDLVAVNSSSIPINIKGAAMMQRPSVDGMLNWISFRFASGNIQSGSISLYGSTQ